MDLATLIGLVGGAGMVLAVMMLAGGLLMFWDVQSVLVVLGGGGFATMIRWPLGRYLGGISVGMNCVFDHSASPNDLINEIVQLADIARKQSVLALEKVEIEDKYLSKAVKFMVDGYDPAVVDDILNVEIGQLESRHKDGRAIFEQLGEACPAFGMIGTVIGLVVIMANLSNPDMIGPGLAVALLTTLYGAVIANLVFIPMASKLEARSKAEVLNLEVIKEGVASITKGDNPRTIRERLESFLSPSDRGSGEE